MMPTRRRSIHKEGGSPKGEKDLGQAYQCDECGQIFLEWRSKDGVERKMVDEEKYNELKKAKLYPDLSRELTYTCEACKGTVAEGIEENDRYQETKYCKKPENKQTITGNIFVPGFNLYFWSNLAMLIAITGVTFAAFTLFSIPGEEALPETPFGVHMAPQSPKEKLLEEDMDKLEETYASQEERVWYTLLAGIKSVVRENPNQPSVFLMLYDSESAGHTARCIAQDVTKVATKFLMGRQHEAFTFSGSTLQRQDLLEDPGKLLVWLNQTVRERGSLLVTELQNVPPKVAKSFHFICDKYSPLVERAVLFFTLNVNSVGPRVQKDAEARLTDLWSNHMEDNFLNPLITRMTPNILKIKSDYHSC